MAHARVPPHFRRLFHPAATSKYRGARLGGITSPAAYGFRRTYAFIAERTRLAESSVHAPAATYQGCLQSGSPIVSTDHGVVRINIRAPWTEFQKKDGSLAAGRLKRARDVFRDAARDLALAHDDEIRPELRQVFDLLVGMRTRYDL